MVEIYGTIGPSCQSIETLEKMFRCGMTGIRLNLSHTTLDNAAEQIENIHTAAKNCSVEEKLLVDMQGPELRIGKNTETRLLVENEEVLLGDGGIEIPKILIPAVQKRFKILIDDGKILLEAAESNGKQIRARVMRGGTLHAGKSIAVPEASVWAPTMTEQDLENIKKASAYGVTGVMQPFVRNAEDLRTVRKALDENGGKKIRLFAKIENLDGVQHLKEFFPIADEIVIARGDLGNAVPLWELPGIQKKISDKCQRARKPFMVVTQMLASMEHSAVPTRAEVSDIFRAVQDGAASVMVTGETAVGEYPVEVIRYLSLTAHAAENFS